MTNKPDLRRDIPSGIVVFFVAIPLCLGIALASGAPLLSGLIAGIVGGIVVGSLSSSALGVSGPAAGLAVIVAAAIADLGSFEAFLAAVVLAGIIQMGFGLARAGVLAYFFPSAVVKGMLSGIGLLIILKQIPYAIGWNANPGDFQFNQIDGGTTLSELWLAITNFAPSALFVAAVSLAILITWDQVLIKRGKIFQLIQGPLVAVVVGILYQVVTSAVAPEWALTKDQLVKLPEFDGVGDVFGSLVGPDWSQLGNSSIYLTAFTIAVVASLETLLCVEATDKLDPVRRVTPTNRELFAQGVGNTVSGLVGGLPVTQVIVRSSANIQSGATSKVSAIWHGVLLLVAVLFAAPLMNLVPLAALAAILLVVGYKLAKPSLFKQIYDQGPGQFVPFMVTIVAILLTDLLTGVFLGLGVGLLGVLYRAYANSHWVEMRESDDAQSVHHVDMRLGEHVSFLSRGAILRQLTDIPDGSAVSIDMSRTHGMDHDVREILEDFQRSAERRKLQVDITPPSPKTRLRPVDVLPKAQPQS
ncbi:MAG: SulP family inorganic anion transporter [Pseudomonadota bacterium]